MNDSDLDRLCGMVMRGTSLPVACEIMGLDVRSVLDEAADEPSMLVDLFTAMITRARARQQVLEK